MSLAPSQVVVVLLPVVVGALIGVVPAIVLERMRDRAQLRTRWDTTLYATAAQFAASVRRILDLAEQIGFVESEEERASLLEDCRAEHSRLQVRMAEVRLLAGPAGQLAARSAVGHTWSLYLLLATGTDPKADEFDQPPRHRALASLFDFYRVMRRQLRVPDSESLAPLNLPATP